MQLSGRADLLIFISSLVSLILAVPSYNDARLSPRTFLGLNLFPQSSPTRALRPFSTPRSAIHTYRELAWYAMDGYCSELPPGSRVGSDGRVLWKFGNGDSFQQVFIAYSPTLGLIVSYEGTKIQSISSVLDDIDIILTPPSRGLQYLGAGVEISQGFQNSWAVSAQQVLRVLRSLQRRYNNPTIWVTGHSLGGASAVLSALFLNHYLDADVKLITYGQPRVGNQRFADAVNHFLPYHKRIVNNDEIVTHLPGKFLGYVHAEGEVWIANERGNRVYDCPGQENSLCSDSVPDTSYSLSDHLGLYFGVAMKCTARYPRTYRY